MRNSTQENGKITKQISLATLNIKGKLKFISMFAVIVLTFIKDKPMFITSGTSERIFYRDWGVPTSEICGLDDQYFLQIYLICHSSLLD